MKILTVFFVVFCFSTLVKSRANERASASKIAVSPFHANDEGTSEKNEISSSSSPKNDQPTPSSKEIINKMREVHQNNKKNKIEEAKPTTPPVINSPCPEKCTCFNDIVNCTKAGKTAIPSLSEIPPNTKVIDLTSNKIEHVSTLDHPPKLTKLVLRFNSIKHIEPEVFSNLTNLKELDLSFNENIDLSTNFTEPLEGLKVLKLTNCNLNSIEPHFFENNPHLTHLYLDSNPLDGLEEEFFKNFKDLQFLNLDNTKLALLEIGKKYPLNNLKVLNLANNVLDRIPLLRYAPNIEQLVLDYNRIGVLNKDSFIHLKNLKELHLSHNEELLDVEELTFTEQTNIEKLILSNNPNLFLISQHAFYGAYNATHFPLKELNLQKNSLHYISENMLTDHWGKLDVLDLRMNPWNCDCHLGWLHKYKSNRNVSEIRCKTPDKLTGKRLTEVEPKKMVCVKLIDSLLYEKLKGVIQGFMLVLAFLVFTLAFLLIYVVRDRPNGWMRLFGSPSSSTIYYQKANTKEQPVFM